MLGTQPQGAPNSSSRALRKTVYMLYTAAGFSRGWESPPFSYGPDSCFQLPQVTSDRQTANGHGSAYRTLEVEIGGSLSLAWFTQ